MFFLSDCLTQVAVDGDGLHDDGGVVFDVDVEGDARYRALPVARRFLDLPDLSQFGARQGVLVGDGQGDVFAFVRARFVEGGNACGLGRRRRQCR